MNNSGIQVAVKSGYKTLSEITDFKKELEESGLYNPVFSGNHILYIPQQGAYCIKKSTIWSHESVIDYHDKAMNEALIKDSISRLVNSSSGNSRFVDIYDYILVDSDGREDSGVYDVYMYMDKVTPIENLSAQNIVNTCISICDLLISFEGTHNNVNHQNVFLNGNGVVLGNPSLSGMKNEIVYYNAPEILRGEKATASSDVYSLGIWMYYMLRATQENIFADRDRYGITDNDIKITKNVGEAVVSVIRKAVHCDPGERYKNPDALKKALEDALKKDPNKGKKVLKVVGVTTAAILICGAVGWYGLSNYDPGAKEIRTMIASGSYSLAYEEICARSSGEATDELIKEYIQGCMDELDYQRAAQIIPEFSQEMFDSPDYLEDLFYDFRIKGKMNILEPIMSRVYSRSEAIADIIDRIR